MDSKQAVAALSALAHETRLELFRLLIRMGAEGMTAGALAHQLDVAPSTLSHHLGQLEQAGIITARRESRHIFYAAAIPGISGLLSYLIDDCCQGAPEICGLTRPAC
jgi:DNA-binding transcriptional ArsR family regulator